VAARARNKFLAKQNQNLKLKNKVLEQAAVESGRKTRLLKLSHLNKSRQLVAASHQKVTASKSKLAAYKQKINDHLLSVFTKTQIKILLGRQTRSRWSNEDIGKGITLRYKHNPYEHLRSIGFPFPATRTLQTWTRKIVMEPGISYPTLNLLKNEFQGAPEFDRQCVIGFDEMSIDSSIVYDSNEDKIYGPKNQLNCWFVRGLFRQWKQVIAYEFDESLTVDKFNNLVTQVENCGLGVRACVNDLGGKNRGLWNRLGAKCHVSESVNAPNLNIKSYCENPVTKGKLWLFADAPHLLKLMRNNLLAKGFTLRDGYKISKSDFERLVALDSCELQANFRLSKEHLNLVGKKKQKVSFAVHLFSRETAEAWNIAYPNRSKEGRFLRLVALWFEIFNSRYVDETIPTKRAFGLDLEYQLGVLQDMFEEILDLRVGNSRAIYPFQRGVMSSIESLKGLFFEVSASQMNISYILTCRLNQDFIENFFSMVRQAGGFNDNPSAVDAKKRIKIVALSWGGKLAKTTSVAQEDEDCQPFLTARMMDSLLRASNTNAEDDADVELDPQIPEANELSEDNYQEVFVSMSKEQKFEEFGKEYLCGWVASRLLDSYPNFKASPSELFAVRNESWVKLISQNGLTIPSLEWRNMAAYLEIEFRAFHSNWTYKVSEVKGVLKGFISALVKKYEHIPIPEKAIEKYIRARFNIRVDAVNKKIEAQAKDKREKRSEAIYKAMQRKAAQPLSSEEFEILTTGQYDDEDVADYEDSDEEEDGFDEINDDGEPVDEALANSWQESIPNATRDLSFDEYLSLE